ncbi:MAG: electron transfer flavoprotein subunit beta/FixA family protein [Deltaproteobacteria bacterium]|nr:electron transfer flavoprotein subunit beta/FixA family protein [Deltaproteobacteria bacterium]
MKIGVLLKQVPDTETRIKLKPDGSGIDESDIKWVVNPYDEFAVEEALQLKEKRGGEVVIVSAGPPRVVEAMRTALAMGADRGIRIDTTGMALCAYTTALMLAKAAEKEGFDLLLGGKQAVDDDNAQVLQGVAELLGRPIVSIVEKITVGDDGKTLTVQRPVAGGIKEVINLSLPALLGCEKGLNTPRYPSLPGIMKAKAKPMVELKGSELLSGEVRKVEPVKHMLPPERQAGKKITGEPAEVVEQLVKWLREEAKVV